MNDYQQMAKDFIRLTRLMKQEGADLSNFSTLANLHRKNGQDWFKTSENIRRTLRPSLKGKLQ